MHYWVGGMAKMVEHLPRKCKALSANLSTAKKKKKKRKQIRSKCITELSASNSIWNELLSERLF
jgi:hypothetical protein